jgi:hypothetical protein
MRADLGFRRMNAEDLRLMHEWLQRDHVRRWWSDWSTYEEVAEHYLPAIEGQKRTDLYVRPLTQSRSGRGQAAGVGRGLLKIERPPRPRERPASAASPDPSFR